ncbi:MAG: hypothetical protein EXR72_18410 [Myxococcales bacterium]|nr:hypothetical protein [Myxococcales bacterium]
MLLERFLPELLRRRLAADPASIAAPNLVCHSSAVLLADISGFTPLAERLAERGPEGAEELTRCLDTYFGELIDLVTDHGGDVVKFAGDALLAVWRASAEEDTATATRRAAQCGLAIQGKLNDYAVGGDIRLSLRVTIATGDLHFSNVGGVLGRWELLVWGEPLAGLAQARAGTQPGQVVVPAGAWAHLHEFAEGTRMKPRGNVRIDAIRAPIAPARLVFQPIPIEAHPALLEHIPGTILTRVNAGQTRWLGELRRVVALFAKFPASTIDGDPRRVAEQTHLMMRALQTAVYRYEGNVNKISVDEKGIMLLAGWGLPPLAHEDDAARAVKAALTVQADLATSGLSCAIGIATGQVFCGVIGNAVRGEYTVIGDAVNLAARLMEASQASIRCDPATFQKAKDELQFEALPAIAIRGKARPVLVYRPTGAEVERVRQQGEMIGRNREREVLAELLNATLRSRDGGVVVIEGDAGMGKSRLVTDVRERAQQLGVRLLSGGAHAVERTTPYFAWRAVFSQLFDVASKEEQAIQQRVVKERLAADPELLAVAPLLNVVMPMLDLGDSELTAHMSGAVRASNAHALLVRLLRDRSLAAPLVVVFEDGHWLDSASWALLKQVHAEAGQVALVLSTRPMTEPPPEYGYLLRAHDACHLRLETMTPEQTLDLVCQRLGARRLPDAVGELILTKAEGNPFFSEELAFALRDAGHILVEGGECTIAPGSGDLRALSLPDTVQGVVTSRVDRLTPSQQITLKVASVIGHIFALRILHEIHPVPEDRLHLAELLPPLCQLEIIQPIRADDDPLYRFKHAITEEAVYNLMLFAQRRELHRTAALWIERANADQIDDYYPLLAHHWSKAEDWPKAVEFLEKSGQQALDRFANQAAIAQFQRAVTIADRERIRIDPERRGYWQRCLAHAHYGTGQFDECKIHSERALAALGWPVPTSTPGLVLSLVGQILLRVAQSLLPRWFRARDEKERERRLWGVRLQNRLSELFLFAQNVLGLVYSGLRELNLAEPAGPSAELGRAYSAMAAIVGTIPMPRVGDTMLARSLDNAGTTDPVNEAFILTRCGVYGIYGARWPDCEKWFTAAYDTSKRLGDGRVLQDATIMRALTGHYQGRFAESAELCAELLESATARGSDQGISWARMGRGMNFVRLGRAAEALPLFDPVLPWLADKATLAEKIWGHGMRALALLRAGDPVRARGEADRTLALVEEARPVAYWTQQSTAAMCEVYQLLLDATVEGSPERSELLTRLRRAAKGMRSFGGVFPFGGPAGLYWQGIYEAKAGKIARATARLRDCLASAERLAMPFEQGLAHRELGRILPGSDPERPRHAARAREILSGLGAVYDVARIPSDP